MLLLNFYEYINMKKFLNIKPKDIYEKFECYIRESGFSGTLNYDNEQDRKLYIQNILDDIFIKDIKANQKIKNLETFTNIQRYVINNFGNPISAISIQKYYNKTNRNVDIRTIENTSSFYVILKFYIHAIPLI